MNAEKSTVQTPIFIAGPTAVGKSAAALAIAEQLGGEIISVDSMQVYRGLNIGTAKPSSQEQKQIAHHLIDVVDLDEGFDAAKFCELAKKAVGEIQSRNRVPIFCGGTGFYFKAFLEGLGEAPPADSSLRTELEQIPVSELLRELETCDPVTFGKIDRQNLRRVIRAVEVIRLTGKPFSEQRNNWANSAHADSTSARCFGLSRANSDLHSRINRRVDEMFALGLVAETENLLRRGLGKNQTAMQAIGYRQVVEHLAGKRSLPDTIDLVKIRTRQFAKRQMTWFRRQMQLKWIQVNGENESAATKTILDSIVHPN